MVTNDVPSAVYPLVMPYTGEQARSSSERTSCEIVYEELVPNGDRRRANGRSSPESEYTRLQLSSEYTRLQLGWEYARLQLGSEYTRLQLGCEYTRLQLGCEYTRLQLGSEYTRLQLGCEYAR